MGVIRRAFVNSSLDASGDEYATEASDQFVEALIAA